VTTGAGAALKVIHLNGMAMDKGGEMFNALCSGLGLKRSVGQSATDRLNKFFSGASAGTKVVLVLDEIDALVPRKLESSKQELLYQLFEWTTRSAFAVIAISNTMDLPERLSQRVQSRMGSARLSFMPYSRDQIRKMVEARIVKADATNIVSPDALGMLSVKVAQMSGDARKAMQLMQKALEAKKPTGGKVTAADIHNACLDKFRNFYREAVVGLPTTLLRVVLALFLELGSDRPVMLVKDVWKTIQDVRRLPTGQPLPSRDVHQVRRHAQETG
jgi:Cdc6-like AAA superfamily ATPase